MARVDLDEARSQYAWDRTCLALIDELSVAREKLDAIEHLLASSPIGPTRTQAVNTLFEIRQVTRDG